MCSLGALAVDDRRRRARFAAVSFAQLNIERVMDALQCPVPVPQVKIVMHRALRRQVLRQGLCAIGSEAEWVSLQVNNLGLNSIKDVLGYDLISLLGKMHIIHLVNVRLTI